MCASLKNIETAQNLTRLKPRTPQNGPDRTGLFMTLKPAVAEHHQKAHRQYIELIEKDEKA
ncbi:MAG: hypothetical protein Q4B25_00755, partial [Pseudomonadota bacterium]|nr:hypothetical protein [Pseudomonadota bacterium]